MSKSKGALVVYKNDKLTIDSAAKKAYQQDRADYLESVKKTMNPNLITAADRVRTAVDSLTIKGFHHMWKMGKFLHDIEINVQQYEEGGVRKIANYLRYSPEQLYKWIGFHNDYDEKAIERLQELKLSSSSSSLSWQHIEVVRKLKDQELRMQSLELAADLDWTPNELDEAIREKFSSRVSANRHPGGRPFKPPSSYKARLENLDKICHIIVRNDKECWRHSKYGFLQTIDEVPADKLPKLVNVMDKEAIKVEAAIEKLTNVHKELIKARATAADRIEEQAKSIGTDEGKVAGSNGKRRGRPPGSKNRDKSTDASSNGKDTEDAKPLVSILDD